MDFIYVIKILDYKVKFRLYVICMIFFQNKVFQKDEIKGVDKDLLNKCIKEKESFRQKMLNEVKKGRFLVIKVRIIDRIIYALNNLVLIFIE